MSVFFVSILEKFMVKWILVQVISVMLICAPFDLVVADQDHDNTSTEKQRPKIGLVLSGGGARGAAHIGVLKALEENRIPVDVIAGTSFGAIVGGLYASGYSASELEETLQVIDWQATLSSRAPRERRSFRRKQDDDGLLIKFKVGIKDGKFKLPSGLVTPNNLRLTLRDLISEVADVDDFDHLAIPFRAVATDLETGLAFVLDHGDLPSAMVASMAVPALFPPVERGGKLLVDGGVANNLPIDVARQLGADIVIVVDVSTSMMTKEKITSFTSVIQQLTLIMTHQGAKAQLASLKESDVLIKPDLGSMGLIDFEHVDEAIPKGEKAVLGVTEKISKLALSPEQWRIHLAARHAEHHEQPVIDFVRIHNETEISDKVIEARLSNKPGDALDRNAMTADLTEIYGLELFEEVNYDLVEEDGLTGIDVYARPPRNGEDHLRFGLALQEDFEGESGFQLAASYTNLAINKRGGELSALFKIGDEFSLAAEFYQPIDFKERYFVFANADGRKLNSNSIDESGTILSQARVSRAGFQIGAGRNFGRWGSLRLGLERSFGKIRGRVGLPKDLSIPFDQTAFIANFSVDTLDNIEFPQKGMAIDVVYSNQLSFLKGDSKVDSLRIGGYHPFSWGRNTLGLNYSFGTTFNGTPDETNTFSLGGFLNLTAFTAGQLSGNHGGTLGAIYYRRISGGPKYLTHTPIYVGGLVEAGNVWNTRSDMSLSDLRWSSSLFIGADTIIGPVYLGGAIGSEGQTSAFLFVGQLF